MRLGIIGGRLQGTEAAYLAREAGYEVVVVDRVEGVPAAGLADEFHPFDVRADEGRARRLLGSCDAVLPACENARTLAWLATHVPRWGVPLLFDPPSYALSSSKLASDRFFAELGVPRPLPWPECGFPAVVKPSGASGSAGVHVVDDQVGLAGARALVEESGHEVVVQEYVAGASLSLEVLALDGRVVTLLPTLLEFDRGHDCMRVLAPVDGRPEAVGSLHNIGRRLAEGLGLVGLMDVEVMLSGSIPKVIEIDARFPSQTPTAVYHCCGTNMVALMVEEAVGGDVRPPALLPRRAVVCQHILVADGRVEVLGEHVMAGAGPLRREVGFYGATVALTDYVPDAARWAATLVMEAGDVRDARRAADAVVNAVALDLGLTVAPESTPSQGVAVR